jgi:hypothetical protein
MTEEAKPKVYDIEVNSFKSESRLTTDRENYNEL